MVVLAVINALILVLLGFMAWRAHREISALKQGIIDFIVSPDDNTPSQLSEVVQICGKVVAHEFTQSISGMMMGKASAVNKGIDSIGQELAVQQNPMLALLSSFSPKITRKIGNNPMLSMAIQQALQGFLGQRTPGNNHGNEIDSMKIT